jgi:AraC-like DNA-binding protein/DNA-binding MarR family transcriptional regulator
MDVLSDILRVLGANVRIDGSATVDKLPSQSEGASKPTVYVTIDAPIRVECERGESFELGAGDGLFLLDGQSSLVRPRSGETNLAEVITGRVHLDADQPALESGGWPSALHIRAGEDLGRFAPQLAAEVRNGLPGWQAVASGLAYALLVSAFRGLRTSSSECPSYGWLRGLSDPEVGPALRLIHEQPGYPWTVAELADRLAISRSAFAARFKQVTGRPPLAYLTWWRLSSAAARLRRRDGATIAQLAREAGYETEAAFSKAFRRQFGRTPGQVRREAAGPRPATPLQAELKKRNSFDIPEQEVAINLMRSAARLSADFASLLGGQGLTSAQYNVLRILRGEGTALPTAEVSSRLIVPNSDNGELFSSLASSGFIRIDSGELLTLTAAGRELIATLDLPLLDLHRRQLAHFSSGELAELDRLLVKARRVDY